MPLLQKVASSVLLSGVSMKDDDNEEEEEEEEEERRKEERVGLCIRLLKIKRGCWREKVGGRDVFEIKIKWVRVVGSEAVMAWEMEGREEDMYT